MNWKNIIQSEHSEIVSDGIIDVVNGQGNVEYANQVEGILTVNLYVSIPEDTSSEFKKDVIVASLIESGYNELKEFNWYDSKSESYNSPWERNTSWEFTSEEAIDIAKQTGLIPHGRDIFGTVEVSVNIDVPLNWSEEEIKYTCIGQLLKNGFENVLYVDWAYVV